MTRSGPLLAGQQQTFDLFVPAEGELTVEIGNPNTSEIVYFTELEQ